VNNITLEKLQEQYDKLKATIITTGFWKLTSSNIERIRKLKKLEKEIEIWNLTH
tara:strand:- start:177 stop:338 length:162 start_codon:yes stop_codon:yes gene_type:complete